MYKKILLCVLLIFSILITGCGKTELSDIETATLYMNAAYSGDATIAKGTGLEDEVSAFVYNVDKQMYDVLVYNVLARNGIVYTQDELNRLIQSINKIKEMTKVEVKYLHSTETYSYARVMITKVDSKYFTKKAKERLVESLEKDKEELLKNNARKKDLLRVSMPYLVKSFEETTEEIVNDRNFPTEQNDYSITLKYNKITKKWDLIDPDEQVKEVVRQSKLP
ncbi:hypothetical protein [Megamonas hypermegale]|uniref:hypothetical protein n=1 Tax=Megamonas hypermegale TaxID=158847 RepID=UPI0026E9A320|nr:hypothetical protein [Megamonas hypermegale]